MNIYIYRNKTSGKRYIGYTTRDVNEYLGSGTYWKNHCNKHGGLTEENIEREWVQWFDCEYKAKEFLSDFEEQHPEYYEGDDWCNLVPETLDKSPFKGNMKTIFEKNGNPFSGGDIQRKAHAEGRHNYDRSEAGRKSWENRDKSVMVENVQAGHKEWRENNREEFLKMQKEKAEKSKLVLSKRIMYNGVLYLGWSELREKTGITRYKFNKYNMGTIL